MMRYKCSVPSLVLTMLGLVACAQAPDYEEVVGAWSGPKGAELYLHADRTFVVRSLPRDGLFPPGFQPNIIDGSGTWALEMESGYWAVRLSFTRIAQHNASVAVSILIGRQSDCIYLYQWVREEGGLRNKFQRAGSACSEPG